MRLLLLFALLLLTSSCSTVKKASNGEKKPAVSATAGSSFTELSNLDYTMDLTTHLIKIPGVRVAGFGATARIRIRGSEGNSFLAGEGEPLFVINQLPVRSYFEAYNMLTLDDVGKIKVLKGSDASIYGTRGVNGVVLISSR